MSATQWTGQYADVLNGEVVYPYKIHTGKLRGYTKYTDGPRNLNVGDLIRLEFNSMIDKKGDKWVNTVFGKDDAVDLVFDDEFSNIVFAGMVPNTFAANDGNVNEVEIDVDFEMTDQEVIDYYLNLVQHVGNNFYHEMFWS